MNNQSGLCPYWLYVMNIKRSVPAMNIPANRSNPHFEHADRRTAVWGTLASLLLLMSIVTPGRSAVNVCGTIAGGHWTKANSPYLVTCDVFVADLTIDSGVNVQFVSNCVFEVGGVLTARGTWAEPILFTSTNSSVGWQGIFFNSSGTGSELDHCCIQNSKKSGIRVQDSSPVIRNCVINNNTTVGNGGGVWVQNSTYDLVLQDCTIINNQSKGDNSRTKGVGGGIAAFMGSGLLRLSGCKVLQNATVPYSDQTPYWNDAELPGGGLYIVGSSGNFREFFVG